MSHPRRTSSHPVSLGPSKSAGTGAHFLHGTLFIFIKNASNLGRSAAVEGAACSLSTSNPADLLACTISHGARFVGKKMLNAVRATNNVRISLTSGDVGTVHLLDFVQF